jgi:type IV secretion system protein VirB10
MTPTRTPVDGDNSIRPIVASAPGNQSLWIFGVVLAGSGFLLFRALESRRDTLVAPPITAPVERSAGFIGSPPELQIAANPDAAYSPPYWQHPSQEVIQPGVVATPIAPRPQAASRSRTSPAMAASLPQIAPPTAQDYSAAPPQYQPRAYASHAAEPPTVEGSSASEKGKERVEATRFLNPGTTVPKGTVIQAVLETALDSNRAGFARAIVSRDVISFDGAKVLIPRGSRIIGEYKSDIALGQNRVLIQWQRLTRPDGIVINMDSPSADPLGRAGVKGKVNSHFVQRFAGAILQSALDIGVQLATREVSRDSIYIGLPGTAQNVVQAPDKIQPTVTVRQGSSVSVFVARDLDFTKVT